MATYYIPLLCTNGSVAVWHRFAAVGVVGFGAGVCKASNRAWLTNEREHGRLLATEAGAAVGVVMHGDGGPLNPHPFMGWCAGSRSWG